MIVMTLYHFVCVLDNNVPDPNDGDDEMEASGTSEMPSQGGDLHVLNSVVIEYCISPFIIVPLTTITRKSVFFIIMHSI